MIADHKEATAYYWLSRKVRQMKLGKFGKFLITSKRANQLAVNEITQPRRSGRYKGVSIGRDSQGYFVTTHRARSKSYPSTSKIPKSKIRFVASTG